MSDFLDKRDVSEDEARERLEEHRDLLEKLASMDVPASQDAQRALEFLNEKDQS